jgi:carbonic anhydrase
MKTTIAWAASACLLLLAGGAAASPWAYQGERGPEHWARLDPAFALCGQGRNQSPVDIRQALAVEAAPLAFDYTGLVTQMHNQGGQSIRADYAAGSSLTLDGKTFALQYLSFHAPSEHQVEGRQAPLEVQLVHRDAQGQELILAVLYDLGEEHAAIQRLWQQLPAEADTRVGLASRVRAEQFLPKNHAYYRINGSLTTPPCSEGIIWLLLQERLSLSAEQLQQFHAIIGEGNNRPVQALNARIILESP